jgi:hypothetical protein
MVSHGQGYAGLYFLILKLTEYVSFHYKKIVFTFLLVAGCLWSPLLNAHNINYALEAAPTREVVWFYLKLGFEHIIPAGLDHILFVVGLCLLNNKLSTALWQATAFTIAHSITLALSMQNVFAVPASIVEPLIALSIIFIAMENLILSKLKPWRIVVVFLFGLMHGLGFASALNDFGLPRNKFFASIVFFNLGVELGQIVVIAVVFAFFVFPFGRKQWYRKGIVFPISIIIALIAAYWTFERIG